MTKIYKSAPLPFQGQKRRYVGEFCRVLGQIRDARIFVDLFGGSGLLSHIAKRERPDAMVVYNDFDDYRTRLDNIPRTNALISDLRSIRGGVIQVTTDRLPAAGAHPGEDCRRGCGRLCRLYHISGKSMFPRQAGDVMRGAVKADLI